MPSLPDRWRPLIDDEIARTLEALSGAVTPAVPEAEEILEPLHRYASGGKRLRGLLLLAAHAAHGGAQPTPAVSLAAALELFQTAALLHDDVLDDSDTRRGGPAAHRMVAALHVDRGWHGDAEPYGRAGAILAGDLALMACQRAVGRAVTAHPAGGTLTELFADMADLVTAGQYADMRAAAQPLSALADQEAEIRAVMRSKTASYSAEYPLALGAAVAGGSADAVGAMREAGRDLGVAFQLRDDVLGLFGSPAVTGKPAGDDIREGKRTLLVWHAWRAAGEDDRRVLARPFGDRHASDSEVAAALEVVAQSGALAPVEREIAALTTRARRVIDAAALDPAGTAALHGLITRAVERDA